MTHAELLYWRLIWPERAPAMESHANTVTRMAKHGYRLSSVWNDRTQAWQLAWVKLPDGPRGGKKWQNTDSGKVVYAKEKPGSIRERIAAKTPASEAKALHEKLEKHPKAELLPHHHIQVRKALAALKQHHGDKVLDRIEELIEKDRKELKTRGLHHGRKDTLLKRLQGYREMLKLLGHGDGLGTPDGAGAAGTAGATAGIATIVTARADHTGAADPGVVPEGLRQHLNDHQVQGAAKAITALREKGGFLLADGAGAGKTRQLLATAATFAEEGKKVLLVAPAGIIKDAKGGIVGSVGKDAAAMGVNIKPNFKSFDPLKSGEVHVTTYEQLGAIKSQIDKDTIVLFDEAHAMKNVGSQRATHGREIAGKAGGVVYGTATPADQIEDIGYLFRIYTEPPPWNETEKRLKPGKKGSAADALRAADEVFEKLTANGLMVKREISLDGMEARFDRVALSAEAKADLEAISRGADKSEAAQKLMRQRFAQEAHKIPHAVGVAQQELAEGRQVVLFVAGVGGGEGEGEGNAEKLRKALIAAGVSEGDIAELHGGEAGEGKEAVSRFQGTHPEGKRARVLITTAQSGGTGHNLDDVTGDAPRTQIIITPPFSAIDNAQIWGRTHRLTTKSRSRIHYLFADTDVDRWNADLIRGKIQGLGALVAGETRKQDIPDLYREGGATPAAPVPAAAQATPAVSDKGGGAPVSGGERNGVLQKLKPSKHFSDMTAEESRSRLVELNQIMTGRELHDMLQTPVGRYIPELRKHEEPRPERVREHEEAVAAYQQARQEKDSLEGRLRHLETENRRQRQSQKDNESLHTLTREEAVQKGKDKTKRGQAIYAAEHRAAVQSALAAGKPVPPEVLADYPDLQPKPQTSASVRAVTPVQKPVSELVQEREGEFAKGKGWDAPIELTKADIRRLLASPGDRYKDAGVQKTELKGHHPISGDPRYGHPYSPEHFVRSDATGAMIRHYVVLPNGQRVHPDELLDAVKRGRIKIKQSDEEKTLAGKHAAWRDMIKSDHVFTRRQLTDAALDAGVGTSERSQILREHQSQVEKAIARGDYVPAEVLADYPDLAAQAKSNRLSLADDPFLADLFAEIREAAGE